MTIETEKQHDKRSDEIAYLALQRADELINERGGLDEWLQALDRLAREVALYHDWLDEEADQAAVLKFQEEAAAKAGQSFKMDPVVGHRLAEYFLRMTEGKLDGETRRKLMNCLKELGY